MSNRNEQQSSTGFKLIKDDKEKEKIKGKDKKEGSEETDQKELDNAIIHDSAILKRNKFVSYTP